MLTELNQFILCTVCQHTETLDNPHDHTYDSRAIYKGIDSMSEKQVLELPMGRIIEYTDELFNQYIGYIRNSNIDVAMSILATISRLSKRERIIIARSFRHTYMEESIFLPVTSPQIYCINQIAKQLFSLYITMIENGDNNLTEMAVIIDDMSDQDRTIMLINLDICNTRGNYR